MIQIADLARNKWGSILPALGVDAKFLSGKHGPCPACGGNDRFRFDDKGGKGTFICNACGAGDGFKLLSIVKGWPFAEAANRIRPIVGEMPAAKPGKVRDPASITASLKSLWESGQALDAGDIASRYLTARGVTVPRCPDLRFTASAAVNDHPKQGRLPALLALVRAPDGSPATIHRTYLEGAAKANMPDPRRLMPGTLPKGAAIRLAPHRGVLGVAEGIETACAVMDRFGVPCWSLINATMLADFIWPPDITELRIYGDNDLKFAGQAASWKLAHRAAAARNPISAIVEIPPTPGNDWLDEHVGRVA
ncbi:DUF7146 domain-containing protein [Sphingobium aromaticiconvertens]|uniref:DUF7146 domain-containing protein n=1 Tax=Sphingobium aromaticiconvertens TaxID=365341 RepID=UPI003015E16D